MEVETKLSTLTHPYEKSTLYQTLVEAYLSNHGGLVICAPIGQKSEFSSKIAIGPRSQQEGLIEINPSVGSNSAHFRDYHNFDVQRATMDSNGNIIALADYVGSRTTNFRQIVDRRPIEEVSLPDDSAASYQFKYTAYPQDLLDVLKRIFPSDSFSWLQVDFKLKPGSNSVLEPNRIIVFKKGEDEGCRGDVAIDKASLKLLIDSGIVPASVDGIAMVEKMLFVPLNDGDVTERRILIPAI